ncbi:MAG: serine/threonine protein kinase [Cytophagaceae bacterium]|jgi:serine/threonine protein kinase|nr:serine/threonine protein kinase [Cytophagaceae bacterium]
MFSLQNDMNFYQADEVISSGKFGPVWVGRNTKTQQKVIIKQYSQNHTDLAFKLSSISHPVLQTGEIAYMNSSVYIVRNFVEGSNLKIILTKRKNWKTVPLDFWIKGFIRILDGLEFLHKNGVVHRDIKPSNIVLGHGDEPVKEWDPANIRLIDFEQALMLPPDDAEQRSPFALGYAPPEQLLNRNHLTGPWSDIFSLGTTLYEVLCRDKAFMFHDPEMMLHIQLNLPVLNNGSIDDDLFKIIEKATQKEAFRLPPSRLPIAEIDTAIQVGIRKRYATASEFAADLQAWLDTHPTTKKTGWKKWFF